jgi:hypothetical protein
MLFFPQSRILYSIGRPGNRTGFSAVNRKKIRSAPVDSRQKELTLAFLRCNFVSSWNGTY